ncbi:MAG: hypothetical protein HYS08_07350 [Chlamydiae bacterium]|nr:hypothetical protein [Chlamydiota bacterium]MBI3266311.1 hypothetical protein [Chlamydiota bacterium]
MDWDIQSLSKVCVQCQHPLTEGNVFHCFLVLSSEGSLERKDFCGGCYPQMKASWEGRPDLYSYWEGRVQRVEEMPQPKPLPYERFEILLRKYMVSESDRDRKFTYILALLLERKKIFVHRESVIREAQDKSFLVYEHLETGETFILEDPRLSLNQVEELKSELKDLMEQEFQTVLVEKAS